MTSSCHACALSSSKPNSLHPCQFNHNNCIFGRSRNCKDAYLSTESSWLMKHTFCPLFFVILRKLWSLKLAHSVIIVTELLFDKNNILWSFRGRYNIFIDVSYHSSYSSRMFLVYGINCDTLWWTFNIRENKIASTIAWRCWVEYDKSNTGVKQTRCV